MFNMSEITCEKSRVLISEAGVRLHTLLIKCSLEVFRDLACDCLWELDPIKTPAVD